MSDYKYQFVIVGINKNRRSGTIKIGFIGLGNVGGKLAGSLLRGGFDLTVRDLDDALVKSFVDRGATSVASPKQMAEKVDLIITCLPSPKVCSTVYGLSSGVYAKNKASALKIARRIRAGQCYLQGSYFNLEAPFGGYKQSGNGREWGGQVMYEYIETKATIA